MKDIHVQPFGELYYNQETRTSLMAYISLIIYPDKDKCQVLADVNIFPAGGPTIQICSKYSKPRPIYQAARVANLWAKRLRAKYGWLSDEKVAVIIKAHLPEVA